MSDDRLKKLEEAQKYVKENRKMVIDEFERSKNNLSQTIKEKKLGDMIRQGKYRSHREMDSIIDAHHDQVNPGKQEKLEEKYFEEWDGRDGFNQTMKDELRQVRAKEAKYLKKKSKDGPEL